MVHETRRRGRPRSFDPDKALAAIVEVFRAKGFAAASLDDLSARTGLSRPSLYAAFGDKLAMYLAALEAFAAQARKTAGPALLVPQTVESALIGFYDAMLDLYLSEDVVMRGCLIYATASAACETPQIRARLATSLESLDTIMRTRFAELCPAASEDALAAAAEAAANTLTGLSTRARAGNSRTELRKAARRAARLIAASLEPA